ncbi:patatin-like phospholipase family protein [Flavobacterium succinicans]|uniref:NTE family protein RssA n=1 Tax=Flavobacterium succinicans TaxID=29536 RepID=A0A199XUX7_9FLAO|nr:patatin-like phospholipase family protein [Flavobacterium succinicans]OAZ05217.1 NTE family protein RssA [Flavobacterium succinicans]
MKQKNEHFRFDFYTLNKLTPKSHWLSFFLLIVLLAMPQHYFSQNKKPKVALVLSGGGAKGIAHIPVIQALDSLGIVPDLVVGTSMGSIVGGLYAMGYSGDSIAKIANSAQWDELLGGKVSLNNVSVEEMSEFSRYLIDIDVKNYKPVIKSSLLNDQNLREFLSLITYPAYNISNFDKLPIPYRAMATDILNGKAVILDEGSIGLAMRASMSIPGVFKPVPYQNTILVDGGMLDNFPTDIAKNMGADIIIGSDVGDDEVTIEKLENLSTLIFQSAMLTSNLKNESNKKLCDILFSHYPNLTYSTGDFDASKEIYKEGKIATKQNMQALKMLAEKLKAFPVKKPQLPTMDREFVLDTIVYKNFSDANLKLVEKRSGIKSNNKYTIEDIAEGVRKAMGTNLFNQINYTTFSKDNKTHLQLNASEYYKNQIKASLHFDTFRGFGAIINYTGRNLLGESSRVLITGDIAQQPRIRLQYQTIFGKEKKWWWRSEVYGQRLTQDVYIQRKKADNIQYNSLCFDNQINRNINSLKSYFGFGLNYHYTHLKPKTDPGFNTVFTLSSYYLNQVEMNVHYYTDNLNKVFFASTGNKLHVELSRSIHQDVDINYANNSAQNFSGSLNPFTKFNFNYENRIPIKNKVLIMEASAGFMLEDQIQSHQISAAQFGYASKYFVGGYTSNPLKSSVTFAGLQENELNVSQFIKANLSLQTNLTSKVYLIPHLDLASVGFKSFNDFKRNFYAPKGKWQDQDATSLLLSGGATVSYNTFLGPIIFDTSWVNNNKLKLFFSIGLLFNPS